MFKDIVNKYPGQCGCGQRVAAGAGRAQLAIKGCKWVTVCRTCATGETPTPEPAPTAAEVGKPFPLTDEQQSGVDLFRQGHSLAIQAGAGTGKTSTLVAIAKSTTRNGTLVAFNRKIVDEASRKLPRNVTATTAHRLANQAVGKHYRHRMGKTAKRSSSQQMARIMGIDPFAYRIHEANHVLQPSTMAGYVMKAIANFCNSADRVPGPEHLSFVPQIDPRDEDGERTFENNDALRVHLADAITIAWEDIQSENGSLRFTHDHYLKMWQLGYRGTPVIPGDFILFDEGQDASPVMLDIIQQQSKQVVFVGDSQQAIYEWRGAIDAMETVPADSTTFLTNSFRFGQGIADVANRVLEQIEGAELRLVGRGQESVIGHAEDPDVILCRTNAGAIGEMLDAIEAGKRPALVGGAEDVRWFAQSAQDLMEGKATEHPELSIFTSWEQVQTYVKADALGEELAPLVKLVDRYGVETILAATASDVSEEDADVVVCTAHKSKGCEWDTVALAGDWFPLDRFNAGEYRLLYVAVTRARKHLDVTGCAPAMEMLFPEAQAEAAS